MSEISSDFIFEAMPIKITNDSGINQQQNLASDFKQDANFSTVK